VQESDINIRLIYASGAAAETHASLYGDTVAFFRIAFDQKRTNF
jgi:hypothetical protein